MPFRMGPTELIIVLVVVMIIFGVGKLPQVGSAMGKAIREFRQAQWSEEDAETPTVTKNSVNGKVEQN